MSVSKGTRFDIFKRDSFTCAYCGRTPPEVLLHVDHIVPRAEDGSDDITNLITACADCNLGKGAKRLDEGTAPTVSAASIEEVEERLAQATAYMELVDSLRSAIDEYRQAVIERWATAFGAELEQREDGGWWVFAAGGEFPEARSLRAILKRLPLPEVYEAVRIAREWSTFPDQRTCRYFYGICWSKVREREGQSE